MLFWAPKLSELLGSYTITCLDNSTSFEIISLAGESLTSLTFALYDTPRTVILETSRDLLIRARPDFAISTTWLGMESLVFLADSIICEDIVSELDGLRSKYGSFGRHGPPTPGPASKRLTLGWELQTFCNSRKSIPYFSQIKLISFANAILTSRYVFSTSFDISAIFTCVRKISEVTKFPYNNFANSPDILSIYPIILGVVWISEKACPGESLSGTNAIIHSLFIFWIRGNTIFCMVPGGIELSIIINFLFSSRSDNELQTFSRADRSGFIPSPNGVGTQTITIFESVTVFWKLVSITNFCDLIQDFNKLSSPCSSKGDSPWESFCNNDWFKSFPITENPTSQKLNAVGRPTCPNPITPILTDFVSIRFCKEFLLFNELIFKFLT